MPPKPKYAVIADVLRKRITRGSYQGGVLPGAPKLAAEIGVSYLTMRQAMRMLVDEGMVRRGSNGRLEVAEGAKEGSGRFRITFVMSGPESPFSIWQNAIEQAADHYDCQIRRVVCSHPDDSRLYEALADDFDLAFVESPFCRNPLVVEKLKKIKDRVVTFFEDLTEHGIRCFEGPHPSSIRLLVEHLYNLGHRRIDCFFASELRIRQLQITHWRKSLQEFGCTGRLQTLLINDPYALDNSYQTAKTLLKTGRFDASAAFFLTTSDAIQVMRALYEHGIKVPGDVSVAGFGERMLATMSVPSITAICPEDPHLTALEILEHFMGVAPQPDKFMFRTRGAENILPGESTGPAPAPARLASTKADMALAGAVME